MMREFGFVYDSSMAAPYSNPPLWPYTLDFKMPHKCLGTKQRCPSRSFPGIWELPLNELQAGVRIFIKFFAYYLSVHWNFVKNANFHFVKKITINYYLFVEVN